MRLRCGIGLAVLGCSVCVALGLAARGAARAIARCSTSSTELAFAGRNAAGSSGIYVVRIDRPRAARLTYGGPNGRGDFAPAWSPDGRRIAFDREATGQSAPGNIFVVDADGQDLRQLTTNGDGFDPGWSPDNQTVFYSGFDRGGSFSVHLDGTHRHRLANGFEAGAVSPDGRFLAVPSRRGLLVVDVDGRGSKRIVHGAVGVVAWSPDGHRLAYERYGNRPGIASLAGIRIANADGTGRRRLTRIETNNFFDWSADGTQIAFTDRDGSLYVVNTAGGGLRRLHRFPDYETYDVRWSPDGRWIAFTHLPLSAGYGLYLIRPNGRGLHLVHLPRGVQASEPAWRPCAAA